MIFRKIEFCDFIMVHRGHCIFSLSFLNFFFFEVGQKERYVRPVKSCLCSSERCFSIASSVEYIGWKKCTFSPYLFVNVVRAS